MFVFYDNVMGETRFFVLLFGDFCQIIYHLARFSRCGNSYMRLYVAATTS